MDWMERMTRTMAYIEAHLGDEIDWEAVGRLSLCAPYQFARTFALITDIPLSEYVRQRRLTCAAQDLQQRQEKVIDVALRYGYASPTSFQRAFTLFHGVTPSQARKQGTPLKSYPPMTFHLTIQGGVAMQYRIEEKEAFRVIGYGEDISMEGGNSFIRIPQMWQELTPDRCGVLMQLADGKYPGMFGMMDMCPNSPNVMRYDIVVSSQAEALREGYITHNVAKATYAVFDTTLATIQDTTRRIFSQWLPQSGYEHAPAPEFEYYPDGDNSNAETYRCEIWIPVVRA